MSAKISKEQQNRELLNLMIQGLYNDEALQNSNDSSSSINEEVEEIEKDFSDILNTLDQVEMTPSQRAVNNIMDYARSFNRTN